jgi:hypothetical protein
LQKLALFSLNFCNALQKYDKKRTFAENLRMTKMITLSRFFLYNFLVALLLGLFLPNNSLAQQRKGGFRKGFKRPFKGQVRRQLPQKAAPTTFDATNPFELADRIAEVQAAGGQLAINVDANNPFEIPESSRVQPSTATNNATIGEAAKPLPPPPPRVNPFKTIFSSMDKRPTHFMLFVVLFALLLYLAFLATVFRTAVSKVLGAFLNDNAMGQFYREQGDRISPPVIFLYILFVVSLGVFAYLVLNRVGIDAGRPFTTLMLCFGGVFGIVLLRHFLLKIIAAIFPFYRELNQYQFTISVFHQALGLILVPLVIFMAFSPQKIQLTAFILSLSVIALTYIYRSVRGLAIAGKYIAYHKFHFLLYLCAVEIAPVLLLIKLAVG